MWKLYILGYPLECHFKIFQSLGTCYPILRLVTLHRGLLVIQNGYQIVFSGPNGAHIYIILCFNVAVVCIRLPTVVSFRDLSITSLYYFIQWVSLSLFSFINIIQYSLFATIRA